MDLHFDKKSLGKFPRSDLPISPHLVLSLAIDKGDAFIRVLSLLPVTLPPPPSYSYLITPD